MKQQLCLDNIELGALVSAANDALADIGQDAIDRPYNMDSRTVTIKITIKPEIQTYDTQQVNMPAIDWSVGKTMPGRKGMTTRAYAENGRLVVNPGSPMGGHPNQQTLFEGKDQE